MVKEGYLTSLLGTGAQGTCSPPGGLNPFFVGLVTRAGEIAKVKELMT